MKKSIVALAVLAIAFIWAGPVAAHWEVGMPDKMHYPQLPDATEYGWDVHSSGQCPGPICRVADDFQCDETGWVKDIHFWGSWKDDVEGTISHFRLEIFKNIPAGIDGIPYSRPGQRVWWYDAPYDPAHVEVFDTQGLVEGWWDACLPGMMPNNHRYYYLYNIYIAPDVRWFCQEADSVYWLGVYACVSQPSAQWGWKTSASLQFMDDAVYGWSNGPWIGPLVDRDLAFVITGDADPPQRVPSLTEWGVIILAMLIAAAGVVAVLRRRAAVRAC